MNPIIPWLILHKSNATVANQLARQFSAAQVLTMSDLELRQQGLKTEVIQNLRHPDQEALEADLHWLEQSRNHTIITWEDPLYPPRLKEIYNPPLLLYIKGKPELLQNTQLAMVGSRNPSPMGVELAHYFASALANSSLSITSGLALGIDAASHQATLSAQGTTLAVLGSGIANIYPRAHQNLADKITENGVLISEYAPKIQPLAHHFPQRNRIISGLSVGTLVIEASIKSGSLITAKLAMEQGREVFAVPGSPHHLLAAGCNHLIQQGAKLVNTAEDILEELRFFLEPTLEPTQESLARIAHKIDATKLEPDEHKLLECIGFETTSVDQIIARSGFSSETAAALLLSLELKGCINASAGGYTHRTRRGECRVYPRKRILA